MRWLLGLFFLWAAGAGAVQTRVGAPERYTVQKGDTLWGLAARYLEAPWQWPELWAANRETISNPHRIYPGDVLVLTAVSGGKSLRLEPGPRLSMVKLSPKVRQEPLSPTIPLVPRKDVEAFLLRAILKKGDVQLLPRVVGGRDGQRHLITGDTFFATSLGGNAPPIFHIIRRSGSFFDPDTRILLGEEMTFVGEASLEAPGSPAKLTLMRATEEVHRGDFLIPAIPHTLDTLAPHAPAKQVRGKIISVPHGLSEAGERDVVVVNLGRKHLLETGHVLAVYPPLSRLDPAKQTGILPDKRALVLLFQVFDQVAYGLVLNATGPVQLFDYVLSPAIEDAPALFPPRGRG